MNSLVIKELEYRKDNSLSITEFLDDKSFLLSHLLPVFPALKWNQITTHTRSFTEINWILLMKYLDYVGKKVKKKIDQAFFWMSISLNKLIQCIMITIRKKHQYDITKISAFLKSTSSVALKSASLSS